MREVPISRVTPTRLFNTSGEDYSGPFMMKTHLVRRIQPVMYFCLFTCFATKAIHLEVVSDFTSEAYTAAITHFISHRGLVRHLHSDCGTKYISCATGLKKLFTIMLQDTKLQPFAEANRTKFNFLPSCALHQGGL